MIKNINSSINYNKENFKLIGIVSICKEYKIGWIINNLLGVSLRKDKSERINLVNDRRIEISHLIYKKNKNYIRLISNKLDNNITKTHLISSLSKFDYLIQYSENFFEFESFDIINKLKTNNLIQFANFVDIKMIKEKYLLYL